MKKKKFGYSLNNIPIPSIDGYMECIIDKLESFIHRMGWKTFFFDKESKDKEHKDTDKESKDKDRKDKESRDKESKDKESTEHETYGFNTEKAPPSNTNLTAFENDLYEQVHSIKFNKVHNSFQQQLSNDVK